MNNNEIETKVNAINLLVEYAYIAKMDKDEIFSTLSEFLKTDKHPSLWTHRQWQRCYLLLRMAIAEKLFTHNPSRLTIADSLSNAKALKEYLWTAYKQVMDLAKTDKYRQITNEIKHQALEDPDAPQLAKFLASMGGKDGYLAAMPHYWELQDTVRKYQKICNVSAVYWDEKNWHGEIIRYPKLYTELDPLPQDIEILKRNRLKTVEKYLNFAKKYGYQVCQRIYDDENGEYYQDEPVSPDKVRLIASEGVNTWLSGNDEPKPIYLATETEREGIISMGEICSYYREYTLYIDLTDNLIDGESVDFSIRQEIPING